MHLEGLFAVEIGLQAGRYLPTEATEATEAMSSSWRPRVSIAWLRCRSAGIGCLECKQPLIDKVVEEISGMRKRAQEFEDNPELVRGIVAEGADKAREAARQTLTEVRRAMHLRVD